MKIVKVRRNDIAPLFIKLARPGISSNSVKTLLVLLSENYIWES